MMHESLSDSKMADLIILFQLLVVGVSDSPVKNYLDFISSFFRQHLTTFSFEEDKQLLPGQKFGKDD